jgi:hypothetical protein
MYQERRLLQPVRLIYRPIPSTTRHNPKYHLNPLTTPAPQPYESPSQHPHPSPPSQYLSQTLHPHSVPLPQRSSKNPYPAPPTPAHGKPGLTANTLTPSGSNTLAQSNIIIFSAVLLLRYATILGRAGFGHPLGILPGASALEFRPPAQLDREERPEVIKRRRGVDEARSRGMKVDVKTWVDVTLSE